MSTITRLAPEQWQLLLRLGLNYFGRTDAAKLVQDSCADPEHVTDLEDLGLITCQNEGGAPRSGYSSLPRASDSPSNCARVGGT
jgi:hypothetical protein